MTTTIFSLIQKEIKSGLLGLMVFFLAIFIGYESYSVWSHVREVKNLVIGQVDSLATNKALNQDYLAIQPEVSRFVDSLKKALPYRVEVRVNIDGKFLAGDGIEENSFIPSTKIKSERKLPSGQNIEVMAEIYHGRVISEALALLLLICGSCVAAYIYLTKKMERSVKKISEPLLETIAWVEYLSSDLPNSLKRANKTDCRGISELNFLNVAVGRLTVEIENLQEKLLAAGKDLAKVELAEQVGHDIRAPLTTIDAIIRSSVNLSSNQRAQLEKPILRIMDVLNELNPQRAKIEKIESPESSNETAPKQRPEFLYPLVQDILIEKKTLYLDRKELLFSLEHRCGGMAIVSSLNRNDFSRALSNLIDNAAEAIDGAGTISIEIFGDGTNAKIRIADSGKGIPEEFLFKVGTRKMTYGKPEGSGLGVYHAKQTVEAFGGQLSIESTVGLGTTVVITIPVSVEQKLISDGVTLASGQTLIVVDDDSNIREAWVKKLSNAEFDVRVFSSPEELLSSGIQQTLEGAIFIMDLEFKNSETNGIDLIRRLKVEDRAVLISGKWDAKDVAFQCEHFGIRRFPKELLGYFETNYLPIYKHDGTHQMAGTVSQTKGEEI